MSISLEASALIIVDVQNDFCHNGALPVPEGDKIIPNLNIYIRRFSTLKRPVFVTRDWHPPDHISFRLRGGPWPPHCVQNTWGAELHKDLRLPKNTIIVSKAYERDKEAYSGFQGTDLAERLRALGIKRLFIGGLATDYCVKNTVLDALKEGFEAYLLEDAIKGIDAQPGDSEKAIKEMVEKGAKLVRLSDLV
ncbi:MAG: nicotinamidase [Nitrososphaerota archaeon]